MIRWHKHNTTSDTQLSAEVKPAARDWNPIHCEATESCAHLGKRRLNKARSKNASESSSSERRLKLLHEGLRRRMGHRFCQLRWLLQQRTARSGPQGEHVSA